MLGERPTLELVLGTKRGPEGPSIVQGSPTEGNGVKLIEVDPALSNKSNKAQPAAAYISAMDTPLDHAQDEAMPLIEWALTPMGHCWPKEEYASIIASIIHLDSLCFVTGDPLVRLPKHATSFSDCLKGVECSI